MYLFLFWGRNTVIVLKELKITKKPDVIEVSADVDGADPFEFQLPEKYDAFLDDESVDAFLLLYTWHAMELGVPLEVAAPVSAKFAGNLDRIQKVFLSLCPALRKVKITCVNARSVWRRQGSFASTGFSGGVDSWFTTLKAIQNGRPFDCFLFSSTGQHGVHQVEEVFQSRYQTALYALSSVSGNLMKLESNIDRVLRHGFMQTHTIRNLACALLLQGKIRSYLYSSAYDFIPDKITPSSDMATVEYFLLPLIVTERFEAKTAGLGASRTEKLVYLSGRQEFNGKLYVCTEKRIPATNCGTCFKCRRTLLLLAYLGLDSVIEQSFDYPAFKKRKWAMELGALVAAENSVPEYEVADIIYRHWGSRTRIVKPLISALAAIKPHTPTSLQWRIKNHYPYLW